MSFEIYIQAFEDGQQFGLPLEEVFQSFGEYISKVSPSQWKVYYDSQNSCDIYINGSRSDASRIKGFTVYRPCPDMRLWNSLFKIMGLGHVALYFPGSHILLRSEASVAYMPPDMMNTLGGYIFVKDVKQILNELSAA